MIFQGVIDRRVSVYVGKGGLVPDSGDTALCYAEEFACHPTTVPFLEKFQAIFEALTAHMFPSASCQCQERKIGTFWQRIKQKRFQSAWKDECSSHDRVFRRDGNAEF